MKMVQVMSEAKARPIITPFTTTSADMNIDHGDNSLGTMKVGLGGEFSAVVAAAAGAVGAAALGAAGVAADGVGAACTGAADGVTGWAAGAGALGRCCCAIATEASETIASTASNLRTILNIAVSVLRPVTDLRMR
jgi:hypothetical protein